MRVANETAVIVGGGPAGLTAAHALRKLDPLIIDPDRPARASACGGVLTQVACRMLARYPALRRSVRNRSVNLSSVRLVSNKKVITRYTPPPNSCRILPRQALHSLMLSDLEGNKRYREDYVQQAVPRRDEWRLTLRSGKLLTTRLLIDASGQRQVSRTRPAPSGPHLLAREWKLTPLAPLEPSLHMILFPGGYAGLAPSGDNEVTLSAVVSDSRGKSPSPGRLYGTIRDNLPGSLRRSITPDPPPPHRSKAGFWQQHPNPIGNNHVAIGDAQGFAMPLTGEGLAMALREGTWLGRLPTGFNRSGNPVLEESLVQRYQQEVVFPYRRRLKHWLRIHRIAVALPRFLPNSLLQSVVARGLVDSFRPRSSAWPALNGLPVHSS